MRVPVEWLNEYVTVKLAPEKLAERLTMAGLEVTSISDAQGSPVLELELTPNRADCLSIIGIAREVAAITGQRLKVPAGLGHKSQVTSHKLVTIRIEDRKGCQRYIGRLIEGVRVTSSPERMQQRLLACGARPINTLVDITNYVLLEYGQPLHAFDFKRLAEGTLMVRRARPHELLTTLDGVRRILPAETLVIADGKTAVAVAGIMGGQGSEVTETTTQVLLESALFDPVTVRRTARALGLATESSYRFERGVDPIGVEAASARAAALIVELAGGAVRQIIDVGEKPPARTVIAMNPERVNRRLGTRLSPSTIRTTLARLSCHVATGAGTALRVSVPLFRRDLTQEVDLSEEVARLAGYGQLPSTLPVVPMAQPDGDAAAPYWRLQSLRCLCASLGLTEVITWGLVSETDLARCGYAPSGAVRLANPLSQEHAFLRPSLLMGMLQVVRRNLTQGLAGLAIFEVGHVLSPATSAEQPRLGLMSSGWGSRDWAHPKGEPGNFFFLKGIIETLVARLCHGTLQVSSERQPWAEKTESAILRLNGRPVGGVGKVAPAVVETLDLKQPIWFAELDVDAMLASRKAVSAVRAPALFPPVKRDLSAFLPQQTSFEEVDRAIRQVVGAQASRIELIDRYEKGAQLPPGAYSLTFSIEYRDPSRTLTAAEADMLHRRVGKTLVSRCGATLR